MPSAYKPNQSLKAVLREQIKSRYAWMSDERQAELVDSMYADMSAPTKPEPTIHNAEDEQ